MATPTGRPTYGGWLDQIAAEGRTDDYGLVAAAWAAARENGRPRLHAPKGVNKWLSEHPPPGVANLTAALHQLERAYHDQAGLPAQEQPGQAAAAVQPVPETIWPEGGDPAWWDHQHAHQPIAHDGFPEHWHDGGRAVVIDATGQPVWADEAMPELPGAAYEASEQPAGGYQQPAQAAGAPEHPWQVVLLRLGEIEAMLAGFMQAMAPLLALATEAMQADQALAASQLAQPSAAQQRAQQIAAQHGWTTGPEIPQPQQPAAQPQAPDFYRGHVVPQPNFAAMGEASTGREDQ
jgi:hypothetical protein